MLSMGKAIPGFENQSRGPQHQSRQTRRLLKMALVVMPRRAHTFLSLARRRISSSGINLPQFAPGQRSAISRQAAGVLRFDGQNGQVRHCLGRAA